jgi:photosystem II stability/assembly factor-like uncharacterized protein
MKKTLLLLASILLFTINGQSQGWTKITVPTIASVTSCFFLNENLGWMITYNTIYKTTDGGTSWTTQSHPHYTTPIHEYFFRVQFINENIGIIAVGNYVFVGGDPAEAGSVLWTTDGGNTWIYKDIGSAIMNEPDIKLVNETTAYCIGDYGFAKKTTDGGATWNNINYDTDVAVQQLIPIDDHTVYFAGAKGSLGNTAGTFGTTANGGDSWNISPISTNDSMESIYFEDALHGWIGGSGGEIKRTADAGANWNSCNTGVTSTIKDIQFTEAAKGWAVTADGKVIRSVDGGVNWSEAYSGLYGLNSICFPSAGNIGYAVGDNGTLLKYNPNLAIKSEAAAADFALYPNPANDHVSLEFKNDFAVDSITIYNAWGQLVQTVPNKNVEQRIDLNITSLQTGTYFVEIDSDKVKTTKKFVKL